MSSRNYCFSTGLTVNTKYDVVINTIADCPTGTDLESDTGLTITVYTGNVNEFKTHKIIPFLL